ncbi:MAG: hypothetical protein ACRD3T_22335, partial [Terriglobia bacterium]
PTNGEPAPDDLTDILCQFDREYNPAQNGRGEARFEVSLRLHFRILKAGEDGVQAERSEFILSLDAVRSRP